MRRLALIATLGALVATPGCGGGKAHRHPESALEAFASAVQKRNYTTAYRLLSADQRDRVSFEEFRERLERYPEERQELAGLLSRPASAPEITAEVPYGDGDTLRMRFEEGRWRLVGNVFDFYDQSTPRAALRTFVRAIERRRYDVILRLVPNADREGMTEEHLRQAWEGPNREAIARLVENLRAGLDGPIARTGDHATMAYGERFTAELIFEDGVWKIQDPE